MANIFTGFRILCSIASFSAIQEGYYIKIGKIVEW